MTTSPLGCARGPTRASQARPSPRGLRSIGWPVLLLVPGVLAFGCSPAQPPIAPTKPPDVVVTLPVLEEVTDDQEFTGRTVAIPSVEIRARVTGYLEKTFFKEGDDIKEGQDLFLIDPRLYQADVERARANLVQAQAHEKRLTHDYERAQKAGGSISQSDFEKALGDQQEAQAAVKVAQAQLATSELNLNFTTVKAPCSGRISSRLIDPGNMVQADQTALTTIVSLDPIYASFDADERTVLRARRLIEAKKIQSAREAIVPVWMGLADEQEFPHEGVIDFVDNRVDPNTGTLRVRGRFANPNKVIAPGLFARIRVAVGTPHQELLVPEQALGTEQGQKYLFVVTADNKVEHRDVEVGALHHGLRVILPEEPQEGQSQEAGAQEQHRRGVKEGERVVVRGLQRIRDGVTVAPTLENIRDFVVTNRNATGNGQGPGAGGQAAGGQGAGAGGQTSAVPGQGAGGRNQPAGAGPVGGGLANPAAPGAGGQGSGGRGQMPGSAGQGTAGRGLMPGGGSR